MLDEWSLVRLGLRDRWRWVLTKLRNPHSKQNAVATLVAADEKVKRFDGFLDHEMFPDWIYGDYSVDKLDKDSQNKSPHLSIGVEYGPFQSGLRLRLLRFGNRRNGFWNAAELFFAIEWECRDSRKIHFSEMVKGIAGAGFQ